MGIVVPPRYLPLKMPLNNNAAGANDASQYMISALPWLTASSLAAGEVREHAFPFVTSFIFVKNATTGSVLRVGFTASGVTGSNALSVSGSQTFGPALYRCASLFLSSSTAMNYELSIGLTMIKPRDFPAISTLAGVIGSILALQ